MKKLFLFSLAVAGMSSCQVMYKPNMQNVPLMKEKGEIRATVNTSNLQAAYAISDKVAVLANGYYQSPDWYVESGGSKTEFNTNRLFLEGGAGYFNNIENNAVFEVYGGGGFGNVRYDQKYTNANDPDQNYTSTFSANAIKLFVQPNFGISSENIDFGISSRIVGMKFTSVTTNYNETDLQEENLQDMLNEPMYLFLEPALTFRVGFKWVKFHSQLQYSMKLNSQALNYKPFGVNFGVHINIAERFK